MESKTGELYNERQVFIAYNENCGLSFGGFNMVQKWEIIIMKGESEPWWFFSGWKKDILATYVFSDKNSAFAKYGALYGQFISRHDHVKIKNTSMAAFWQAGDYVYCDSCDDDLQIYYGLLIFLNGEPYSFSEEDEQLIFGPEREIL